MNDRVYNPTPARFTIDGPTCDSIDVLPCQFSLPDDVREGDWIEIDRMAAYRSSAASRFNGFYTETFIQVGEGAFGPARPD